MVPQGFQEEVQQAKQENQPAKLILLGLEAKGAPWQDEGLRLVEHPSKPSAFECVILFTGHRVDSASRKTPRFPASMEPVARKAIRDALLQQQETAKGPMLGIAGGASGGDILFLEICQELGIRTEMLLALPVDQFIKASVESDDKSWVTRFHQQLTKHPNPPVLAQSPELPGWLQFKEHYDIWQRNNLWFLSQALSKEAAHITLIALWDGQTGDGPGGTEHMVSLAKERNSQFIWLKTKELFGLSASQ